MSAGVATRSQISFSVGSSTASVRVFPHAFISFGQARYGCRVAFKEASNVSRRGSGGFCFTSLSPSCRIRGRNSSANQKRSQARRVRDSPHKSQRRSPCINLHILFTGWPGWAVWSLGVFSTALRGLAECLQQELIDCNIRSLVYPPDIMTPGYLEDLKTIPEITKILSGSSTELDAVSVARALLVGVKAGQFEISCNFEGAALSVVCAGMSPQPTLVMGVVEIVSMGLIRIVALFVQKGCCDTILKHKRKGCRAKK